MTTSQAAAPARTAGSPRRIGLLAIALGALVQFALGALWYSPLLFSDRWLVLIGKSFDEVKGHGATPYPIALAAAVASSVVLAFVLRATGARGAARGARIGAALGLGVALAAQLPPHLFEGRPVALLAINAGPSVVGLCLVGALLGRWQGRPAPAAGA